MKKGTSLLFLVVDLGQKSGGDPSRNQLLIIL